MRKNFLGRLLHYKSIIAIVAAVSMVATPIVSYSAVGSKAEKVSTEEELEVQEKATPTDAKEDVNNTELDADGDVVNDITPEDSSDKTEGTNTDSVNADESLDASKASEIDVEKQRLAVEDAIKKLKVYETKLNEGTLTDEELSDIETILNGIADFDFVELEISDEDNAFLESFAKALDEYAPAVADIKLDDVSIDIGERYRIELPDNYRIYKTGSSYEGDCISDVEFMEGNDGVEVVGNKQGETTVIIGAYKLNDGSGGEESGSESGGTGSGDDSSGGTGSGGGEEGGSGADGGSGGQSGGDSGDSGSAPYTFTCRVTVSDIRYLDSRMLPQGDTISINEANGVRFENISRVYEKSESGLIKIEIDDSKEEFTITATDENNTGKTRVVIEMNGSKYSLDITVDKFETLPTLKLGYYGTATIDKSYFENRNISIGHFNYHGDGNLMVTSEQDDAYEMCITVKATYFGDDVIYVYGTEDGTKQVNFKIPVTVYCDYYSTNNVTMDEGDIYDLPSELKIDDSEQTFVPSDMTDINDREDHNEINVDLEDEEGHLRLYSWSGSGIKTFEMYYGNGVDTTYCVIVKVDVKSNPENVKPGLVWYDGSNDSFWWDLWTSEDDDDGSEKVKVTEKTFKAKTGKDIQLILALDEDPFDDEDEKREVTVKYVFADTGKTITKTVTIETQEGIVFATCTPPDTTKEYTCTIDTSESTTGNPVLIVTCKTNATDDDDNDDDNNSSSSSGSSSGGSNTGWIKDSKGWKYRGSDGILAKGTTVTDADGNKVEKVLWQHAGNGYYAFGSDGYLLTGWIYDKLEDKWYYCDENSGKRYGWFYSDVDGYWYYLLPSTGEALTGWQSINGKNYYFAAAPTAPTYSFDSSTGVWIYSNINGNRPFGSMYANTVTPDNFAVDASGAWIK